MPVINTKRFGTPVVPSPTIWNSLNKNGNAVLSTEKFTVSATTANTSTYATTVSTRGVSSGKIYWEVNVTYGSPGHYAYFAAITKSPSTAATLIPGYDDPNAYAVRTNDTSSALTGVYGCYLDLDNLTFTVKKDNATWTGSSLYKQNVVQTLITAGMWYPCAAPVAGDSFTVNLGATEWAYQPTGGFRGIDDKRPLVITPPPPTTSAVSLATFTLGPKSPTGTLSNGDLRLAASTAWSTAYTTSGVPDGKQAYWEVSGDPSTTTYAAAGIMPATSMNVAGGHYYLQVDTNATNNADGTGNPLGSAGMDMGATAGGPSGFTTGSASPMTNVDTGLHITAVGDTFGFALDNRTGGKKLYVHKNGVWYGGDGSFATAVAIISNIPVNTFFPAVSTYPGSVININLGGTAFEYTPPTGYVP